MLTNAIFWIFIGHFVQIKSETVSSVPIRILDAAEKSSNLRPIIYGENRNREPTYSDYYYGNRYNDRDRGGGGGGGGAGGGGPFGSYVIYDDGPRKVFHRWNFNGNNWDRVPNWPTRKAEWINKPQDYYPHYKNDGYDFPNHKKDGYDFPNYKKDGYDFPNYKKNGYNFPKPKPTLSYQSVYSNTIKVYEEPPQDFYPNKKYTGQTNLDYLKYEQPLKPDYEVHYPYSEGIKYYNDKKIPDNFPKIFSPNQGFRFSVSEKPKPGPPKTFYADAGYYRTYTVNYAPQNESRSFNSPERKRSSCNLIRLGSQTFPERNEPCARSENIPLTLPEYPDYSKFSNEDIPMEHRRQNYFKAADMPKGRGKRSAFGYNYGFDSWKGSYSPYERNYNDYNYYSYYPSYDNYDNNLDGNYYRNGYYKNRYDRDRGFGYNRYNSGGRYDYDDEYRNSEETTTRGLTAFLTNGGRRDKSRNNRGEEDDEEGEDSDEEFRSRRRDMFKNNNNSNNNNNRNEDENMRNRQGSNKRRQNNGEENESGEEDRSGQGNYGRNSMRNNRGRYNSRNNDRYNNNRYNNRGAYGHNGSYGSNGNYGGSGSYGNSGSYGTYNSNSYGRNSGYGDMERENRPFGLYGR